VKDPLAQLESGPVFIVGAARSGTTWIYDMLTSHPLVAGAYETWLFTMNQGVGSLFGPAHFPPGHSGLGRSFTRDVVVQGVREFVTTLLARGLEPQHRFLVEKSPSHVMTMPLIREILPEARFVHVLRDGRDVSVSVRAAARTWAPRWRETFGRSIQASAWAWKQTIRRVRRDGPGLGDCLLEMRYEDIKADPTSGLARLFDHCRVPWDRELLDQIVSRTDFDTHYHSSESGFRRGGRVGDWRTHFSVLDRLVFNLTAGDTLIDTGYEPDRRWVFSRAGPRPCV
jgi:Sulfotransferase family